MTTDARRWDMALIGRTALFPVVVLALVGGCGKPVGDVSGVVTFNGKPLPAGRITFLCDGGSRPAVSAAITDGAYAIGELPSGTARITVETFPPSAASRGAVAPAGLPTLQPPDDAPSGGAYVRIADRYRRPDTSGLTVDIRSGRQVHDVALTP